MYYKVLSQDISVAAAVYNSHYVRRSFTLTPNHLPMYILPSPVVIVLDPRCEFQAPMMNSGIVILTTTQKVTLQKCCLTCTQARNLLPFLDNVKSASWMKLLREHLQLNDNLHSATKSQLPLIQKSHQSTGQQL